MLLSLALCPLVVLLSLLGDSLWLTLLPENPLVVLGDGLLPLLLTGCDLVHLFLDGLHLGPLSLGQLCLGRLHLG